MEKTQDDVLAGLTPEEIDALTRLMERVRDNVERAAERESVPVVRHRHGVQPASEKRSMFAENRQTKILTLCAMCFALFMAMLDNTVVNVALPRSRTDLQAGVSGLQWVVDG